MRDERDSGTASRTDDESASRFGALNASTGGAAPTPVVAGSTALVETSGAVADAPRAVGRRLDVRATPATTTGAAALGALAVGALAVGALAVGALAIGRLAVGRLVLKRGHVRSFTVDDLEVGRLRVGEVVAAGPNVTAMDDRRG